MTQRPADRLIADRYAVRGLIGRGGSGTVWRGWDNALKRPVAVKQILVGDGPSTRTRTRALREAQAVAKLDTPGVVRVYDVHEDDGQVCLIMELVDAPSLSRLVRRGGTLTPARAARVGASILDTLEAVHAAGIVHRDIKPSNVLVGDCGVHITDFGIALLADDPALTAAGSVLGTPAYMAPEQVRGERVGPAADLYGLAATLYYAVEGRAPFADIGSVATAQAVRDEPHRPARHLGALHPMVDALLCKDPEQRPGAQEVAVALAAAVDDPASESSVDGHEADGDGRGAATAAPPSHHADEAGTAPYDDADVQRANAAEAARLPHTDADGDRPTPSDRRPRADAGGGADGSAGAETTADAPGVADRDPSGTRPTVVVIAGLLVLLAIALVLLFLAVRETPEAAAVAALVTWRPTMGGRSDEEQRWSR